MFVFSIQHYILHFRHSSIVGIMTRHLSRSLSLFNIVSGLRNYYLPLHDPVCGFFVRII